MDISELLIFAQKQGASDIHISAGEPPNIRIHGELRKLEMDPLQKDDVHTMIYEIFKRQTAKNPGSNKRLDFSMEMGQYGRFRVNCFLSAAG